MKRDVYFDVDSTLVKLEGLDYLAEQKGIGDHVRDLTRRSMSGELPVEEVMPAKMDMIAPSRRDMKMLSRVYKANVVEDAADVVKALRKAGVHVGIVTGNFYPAVRPLARMLGIKQKDVHANQIHFDRKGKYKGIDRQSPLLSSDGKAKVIQQVRRKGRDISFVGDGATDLATKSHVQRFIGFGGVERRAAIEERSDIYVDQLASVLPHVLPRERLERMQRMPVVRKALGKRR